MVLKLDKESGSYGWCKYHRSDIIRYSYAEDENVSLRACRASATLCRRSDWEDMYRFP